MYQLKTLLLRGCKVWRCCSNWKLVHSHMPYRLLQAHWHMPGYTYRKVKNRVLGGHAAKACSRSRRIAPFILNLDSRCRYASTSRLGRLRPGNKIWIIFYFKIYFPPNLFAVSGLDILQCKSPKNNIFLFLYINMLKVSLFKLQFLFLKLCDSIFLFF
jgi:hypothetical protein